MRIGIPKEIRPGETRVAATPETIKKLTMLPFRGSSEAVSHEVVVNTRSTLFLGTSLKMM